MSLNVSYNQNYSSGIETASIREITQQIFQRASVKTAETANLDLTKFNRVTLGTDLYSGKVDAATANQIAMTKTGMQVSLSTEALNSLKYLSSEASKSVFKDVDGKVAIAETKEIADKTKVVALPTFGKLIETTETGSDKQNSNPFYKGELLKTEKAEDKEEVLNIFA